MNKNEVIRDLQEQIGYLKGDVLNAQMDTKKQVNNTMEFYEGLLEQYVSTKHLQEVNDIVIARALSKGDRD